MAKKIAPRKASSIDARRVKVGDVIKGKYQVLQLIGRGGMSRVYLAMDLDLANKQWAIKEVDRNACDPTGRPMEQSLAREANLLARFDHPNIVRIVDTVETPDFIYVVMDHVEGEPLDQVVRREGLQAEEDVQHWMLQVCDALAYLHRQNPPVIYRDMKPTNIMLHPDGYVKLIDFGVARECRDKARRDTIAFGTTGYAAPEQYGKAQTDARTDIYGIGATMWHLLAGQAPPVEFPLPDVRTKNPNVSEGFAEVIIPKCCQLDRGRRYQSAEELAADLEIYDELTREYRERRAKKVRAFAATAIAGVLCLGLGFGCLGARELSISHSFDNQMTTAAGLVHSDTARAEQAYLGAIAYRPANVDAYEGLIECYKVDNKFTTEEASQFNDAYQKNIGELRGSRRYAELEYEIGRLYWYFYDYGESSGDVDSNRATRVKASADHFKAAVADANFDKVEKAKIYDGVASFTTNIATAVKTDDDSDEMYRQYWDNLMSLAQLADGESNETIRLDSYALVTNGIETYMDKFMDTGVTKDEAQTLYQAVCDGLTGMRPKDSDAEQRRQNTLSRLENEARRKITAVYSNALVGQNSSAIAPATADGQN